MDCGGRGDYLLDSLGRLDHVLDDNIFTIADYTYNDLNSFITLDYGNGVTTRFDYDALRRTTVVETTQDTTTYAKYVYGYDDAGNRTYMQRVHKNGGVSDVYQYDNLYQLAQVWYDANSSDPGSITSYDQTQTYGLDPVGNRLQVEHDDGSQTTIQPYGPHNGGQLTNGMNRYQQVDNNPLSYDLRGNTLADGVSHNGYTYDLLSRQILMENGETEAEYIYDAMGRRIAKVISDTGGITTTHFIYDKNFRVIEERSDEATWVARYTYGEGIDEILMMERGSDRFYYHHDALGSVTEVTNDSGALVERYEYDVYGEPEFYDGSYNAISESVIGNPYLFTGRRYDPESGNYYYRARMYSPGLGRFLSMDPLGYSAGDANLYRYVFNNPATFVDPTGEFPLLATMLLGGILNLSADYLVTVYLEGAEYSWSRAGIAFGTGALAGLTGAGIGAIAGRVGAGVLAFAIRVGGNAAANTLINSLQRYLNNECTLPEDIYTDLIVGGIAGSLDHLFSSIISRAKPYVSPMKVIRNIRFGTIDSGKWAARQGYELFRETAPRAIRYWEAAMSGLALGSSNTSVVNLVRIAFEKLDAWLYEEEILAPAQ